MTELKKVLMQRDDLSENEADELISDAKYRILQGEDAQEILLSDLGLELDYIFDLLY